MVWKEHVLPQEVTRAMKLNSPTDLSAFDEYAFPTSAHAAVSTQY